MRRSYKRVAAPLFAACFGALTAFSPAPTQAKQRLQVADSDPLCGQRVDFWERVARPQVGTYCSLLQRAEARMATDPHGAAKLAEKALEIFPEGTLAKLSAARAALFSGDPKGAHRRFTQVFVPGRSVPAEFLSGVILASAGRAALLSSSYAVALSHYRATVLRLSELQGPREQVRVLIEAATVAAYVAPSHGQESRAYLAAASSKNSPLLMPIVRAAWALSFLRDGDPERSRAVVESLESSWQLHWIFDGRTLPVGRPNETLPVLPPGESAAFSAAVAEAVEPKAASLHWEEFYEQAGNSLPEHLRLLPKE